MISSRLNHANDKPDGGVGRGWGGSLNLQLQPRKADCLMVYWIKWGGKICRGLPNWMPWRCIQHQTIRGYFHDQIRYLHDLWLFTDTGVALAINAQWFTIVPANRIRWFHPRLLFTCYSSSQIHTAQHNASESILRNCPLIPIVHHPKMGNSYARMTQNGRMLLIELRFEKVSNFFRYSCSVPSQHGRPESTLRE